MNDLREVRTVTHPAVEPKPLSRTLMDSCDFPGSEELIVRHPQTGALAFKIYSISDGAFFSRKLNFDFYSVLLVVQGKGNLQCDMESQPFFDKTLMRFPVYQPFHLQMEGDFRGYLLQLDTDFFWNHRRRAEVPCKNALFGQSGDHLGAISDEELKRLLTPLELMEKEFVNEALCQYELMISYAEIFLIRASRMVSGNELCEQLQVKHEPHLLRRLIALIEKYYGTRHSPSEYAGLLNVSTKTLNRLTKSQLNKTVTNLITARIVTEAKRELYPGTRQVKEIAARLGFDDEAYFSRFFKRHTGMSPARYRKTFNRE